MNDYINLTDSAADTQALKNISIDLLLTYWTKELNNIPVAYNLYKTASCVRYALDDDDDVDCQD